MSRKKLTKEQYLSTRRNRIPLEALQHGIKEPPSLNSFWYPQPEKPVNEDWNKPTPIRPNGFISDRKLNLSYNQPAPKDPDRTIKFKYSSSHKEGKNIK